MPETRVTIRERRSVRRYTDSPVEKERIEEVLEAGRWAPSGLNNQPWRFLVLRAGDERAVRLENLTKYAHIVRAAPVLIVVLLARDAMYNLVKDCQGAGACIQNMLLCAHDIGLGAVWLGEILNSAGPVLDALGLSQDDFELMAVICMGHPAQEGASARKPLAELLLEPLS